MEPTYVANKDERDERGSRGHGENAGTVGGDDGAVTDRQILPMGGRHDIDDDCAIIDFPVEDFSPGHFSEVPAPGKVYEVKWDQTVFVELSPIGFCSVVVPRLNGCSVAILASSRGQILARIPPRPLVDPAEPRDPVAGERHAAEMMVILYTLYCQYRAYFPSEVHAVLVTPLHQGKIALPAQVKVIKKAFGGMGFGSPKLALYSVSRPSDVARSPRKGLVAIQCWGTHPVLTVEDRDIYL